MKEEEKPKTDLASNEPRSVEVTPERLESIQKTLELVQGEADELARKARERKKAREQEEFQLHSGATVTFEAYLAGGVQEYLPKFPNDNPFFSEMFRLAGWKHLDPTQYVKPVEAKHWLVEIIYYRFHKEALPTLKAKAIPGKHKLFQLLNEEGQRKLIQFRDEAVAMMKTFQDGQIYEFRLAYAKKYKTDIQLKLGSL